MLEQRNHLDEKVFSKPMVGNVGQKNSFDETLNFRLVREGKV